MHKKNKGFTLIELLVVIAILGLLATIVAVSLTSARERARDARRVSDVRQLELALELYYAAHQQYPTSLCVLTKDQTTCTGEGFLNMNEVPTDPTGNLYYYAYGVDPDNPTYPDQYYHVGATLENTSSDMLTNDLDADSTAITGYTFACATDAHDCGTDAGFVGTDPIYDRGVLP